MESGGVCEEANRALPPHYGVCGTSSATVDSIMPTERNEANKMKKSTLL